jgi:hypothetical protein
MVRVVPDEVKKFICSSCGSSFIEIKNLNKHWKLGRCKPKLASNEESKSFATATALDTSISNDIMVG